MCAAYQTGYQEIRKLFTHANMMTVITSPVKTYFIAYVHFASTPPPLHF